MRMKHQAIRVTQLPLGLADRQDENRTAAQTPWAGKPANKH